MSLKRWRRKLAKKVVASEAVELQLTKEREALKASDARIADLAVATDLAQQVAEQVQQQAHGRISKIVSRCLQAVFDDEDIAFAITFERKRGKTQARLSFISNGHEIDPLEASAGGFVDVGAFALRVACLQLSTPSLRRVLILDEPFKFVSERGDYRDKVRVLLETLASEMKVQIVMVTHDAQLQAGRVVDLGS